MSVYPYSMSQLAMLIPDDSKRLVFMINHGMLNSIISPDICGRLKKRKPRRVKK
jgi:hypothetical protein